MLEQGAQVNQLTLGNTSLDLSTAALSCGADSIRLSAREFDIMRLLLQAGERNLSKAALLERVWGYDSDAVENHVIYVRFLRKKLASTLQHPHRVHPPAGLTPGVRVGDD
ncbi:MAG: winged helix-turn-helix domain-containing protein [Flavonifractor plautii]